MLKDLMSIIYICINEVFYFLSFTFSFVVLYLNFVCFIYYYYSFSFFAFLFISFSFFFLFLLLFCSCFLFCFLFLFFACVLLWKKSCIDLFIESHNIVLSDFLPRYLQISLWHFRCLGMGKIDVITYKYVINVVIFFFLLSNILDLSVSDEGPFFL